MKDQAITVTKILAVYASIRHDDEMAKIVESDKLKTDYLASRRAKWEVLQIMLGCKSHWETINTVQNLAKRNKAA